MTATGYQRKMRVRCPFTPCRSVPAFETYSPNVVRSRCSWYPLTNEKKASSEMLNITVVYCAV